MEQTVIGRRFFKVVITPGFSTYIRKSNGTIVITHAKLYFIDIYDSKIGMKFKEIEIHATNKSAEGISYQGNIYHLNMK